MRAPVQSASDLDLSFSRSTAYFLTETLGEDKKELVCPGPSGATVLPGGGTGVNSPSLLILQLPWGDINEHSSTTSP